MNIPMNRKSFCVVSFLALLLLGTNCLAFDTNQYIPVSFHPSDENLLYFTENTSIFYSTDSGNSWYTTNLTWNTKLTNNVFAINPNRPSHMHIATIENNQTITIYRSVDSGKTFGKISLSGLPQLDPNKKNYLNLVPHQTDIQVLFIFLYELDPFSYTLKSTVYKTEDIGVTWTAMDFSDVSVNRNDSLIIYPYIGKNIRDYLNPWYALVVKEITPTTWETRLFKSSDMGKTFKEIINAHFPENQKMYSFNIDSSLSKIFYGLSIDAHAKQLVSLSQDTGKTWTEVLLPADITFIDRLQIHPTNHTVYFYTLPSIYVMNNNDMNQIQLFENNQLQQLWNQPGKNLGESLQLYFDKFHPHRIVAYFKNDQQLFISDDDGADWRTIYPFYQASWESQWPNTTLVGKPAEKLEVEIKFVNKGTVVWEKYRGNKLGLYVYKDQVYSTPLTYNNPASPFFGQSFFADIFTWGASANGLIPNAKAASLQEEEVAPLQVGTFSFHFLIPSNAVPNVLTDDPATLQNETYYREDLSLAYGSSWMPNITNGDPFGIAHVWFAIRVE